MNAEMELTSEPPAQALDLSQIKLYTDGSGNALEQLERNRETIQKRRDVLDLLCLFIAKHNDTLAGLYWGVGYLDPEIELSWRYYRGEKTQPKDIAALWPEAVWKREKEKFGREIERHWVATVDGIKLIIKGAETYEPNPEPKLGEVVAGPARSLVEKEAA